LRITDAIRRDAKAAGFRRNIVSVCFLFRGTFLPMSFFKPTLKKFIGPGKSDAIEFKQAPNGEPPSPDQRT
jgi:hypothetical protein